ncbi:MAG: hypothetical protein NVS3B26_23310 [Mycobacteriales bacterium]
MSHWADGLTTIPVRFHSGHQSLGEIFEESAPPPGTSLEAVRVAVAERVLDNPTLVEAWQVYSCDKRSSPSPFMDGHEVGFFDGGKQDTATHTTPADACVDFICREMEWVLHRRRGE